MKTNPEVFKAYDIRGVYKEDLDEETAYNLGLAFSEMRRKELNKKDGIKVVVGMDMRLSSLALKKELIKGLTDSGLDVIDIGLSSTPTFYFAVAHYNYDGGILVSASHNPKEYNGFKIVREKALPVSRDSGMFDLRDSVMGEKLVPSKAKGKIEVKKDVLKDHIEHDLKFADLSKIRSFKIVIDPANSMGAQYFDELFERLPHNLVRMNWQLDGTFPSHEADPLKFENMADLRKKVKEEKADIGIATDGDGDRIFFVDEQGEIVDPGILRAILSKIFLRENPGAKIAYDIRPGRITSDIIKENGGIPIVTPVGHSLIKAQAVREGAVFAGESSGHFFLNMEEGCYEVPMIVTLKLLQEISESGKTFSEYVKPYKRYYHSGEINSVVDDVQRKIKEIKDKYQDGRQNDLDGITVEYEDWWFNVRGSNTEPKIRLNLEAKAEELMEEKKDEVLKVIRG
ncbi:MAG: phosphomannomutase/phosphoglucomutase [Patescibacteria group bacterium]|nr:phosphomannomutase/phosphoglucomutase [Patescibacteria group bacterium]